VFKLRLEYVLQILRDPVRVGKIAPELDEVQISNVKKLAELFLREFTRKESHLNRFIKASAHGNMRLALDFFRQYVLSGYLRVDEMIAKPRYTLQVHQVLRPMTVPYRLFYDEGKSSVPNVFQIRSEENGSHFTGLRILQMLSTGTSTLNPEYVQLSSIRAFIAETFEMLNDAEKTLDVFLKRGVIESNNRVDEYNESIDSTKITAFGLYILNSLAHTFSYLDLICLDCGVHDQRTADTLAVLGNTDRDCFLEFRKRERMNTRIRKVRCFLEYLENEGRIEREMYHLSGTEPVIMGPLVAGYYDDEARVVRSAEKNFD
jgi:hypothetical protein